MLRGSDYAISETGDSWLMLGDCLDRMSEIPDNSIGLVLTDLPYGTTACKWDSIIPLDAMWKQLNRVTDKRSAVVLFGSEPFSSALRMSNIKNYKYDWVWTKDRATNHLNAKRMPMRRNEGISVFYLKQCLYNPQIAKKAPKNIRQDRNPREQASHYGHMTKASKRAIPVDMTYPTETLKFPLYNTGKVHPTQKPVPLMEYLIKTYTNEGDTVLDFTMGSGTTGVAAKNLKRQFIGIERDTKFFDIAVGRIDDST